MVSLVVSYTTSVDVTVARRARREWSDWHVVRPSCGSSFSRSCTSEGSRGGRLFYRISPIVGDSYTISMDATPIGTWVKLGPDVPVASPTVMADSRAAIRLTVSTTAGWGPICGNARRSGRTHPGPKVIADGRSLNSAR